MKFINFKLLIASSLILVANFSYAGQDLKDVLSNDNNEMNVKTIIDENVKELFYDFLEQPSAQDKNYYTTLRMASNAAGQTGLCSIMATKMIQSAEEESEKISNLVAMELSKKIDNKDKISFTDIKKLNIYQSIVTLSKTQFEAKGTIDKVYEIRKLASSVNECMINFQEIEKKKNSI